MNISMAQDMLLWCTVINYGLLIWWFLIFMFAHDWLYRLHGKWFRLTTEHFDAIHYMGIAIFKLGIFLFNLVPYIALHIVA